MLSPAGQVLPRSEGAVGAAGQDAKRNLDAGILRGPEFVPMDEIRQRARRAASGLAALGLTAGDTIGLLLRNDHPFFEASLAAVSLGVAPVPINWHGTADEVGYVLSDAGARVLVAHADLVGPVRSAVPDGVTVLAVETPADIAARYGLALDDCRPPDDLDEWSEWRDALAPAEGEPRAEASSMIYTSGTTGRPKGVRRLPREAEPEVTAAYMADVLRVTGMWPGMRTVVTGPMYHTAPNAYALTAARLDGLLVLQSRFDPEELLAIIERHRITTIHMVPTMFVRLLRLPTEVRAGYDLSSLTHVVHAAAPCPPAVKQAMIDWLGPIVFEYYGGTETGAVVGCDTREWSAHAGTVGRPLQGCSVEILDPLGAPVAGGDVGEVFMRAPGSDFTYEGRAADRAEVEKRGLFTCGDVGYLDRDGYLYLRDRKRDMIISGGVNVYPVEIEACLLQMAGVAVFGIPDDEFGEGVAAAIEPEPGASLSAGDVQAYVQAHLARFKTPRLVEFHASLPREDSGKIFKRKLRAPHWEGTGRTI
jgi:long-chain acyl-CoA synthetase